MFASKKPLMTIANTFRPKAKSDCYSKTRAPALDGNATLVVTSEPNEGPSWD